MSKTGEGSKKTVEVTCPCCRTILVLDRQTHKVLEKRPPLLAEEESTGDRWSDARKLVDTAGERISKKVEAAKEAQKNKLSRLDALFRERKQELEESGEPIDRPDNIFDDR